MYVDLALVDHGQWVDLFGIVGGAVPAVDDRFGWNGDALRPPSVPVHRITEAGHWARPRLRAR
jgi:hypothetical protein